MYRWYGFVKKKYIYMVGSATESFRIIKRICFTIQFAQPQLQLLVLTVYSKAQVY